MEKVVIRKPKKGDEKDLMIFYNSLVEEKTMTLAVKKVTLKKEREFVQKCLKQEKEKTGVHFALEINEIILGMSGVTIDGVITHHVGRFGIILKKEARGKGLGFKLAKTVISEAKKKLKVKIVTLNVSHRNKVAIGLYKKLGFKEVGIIKKALNFFGRYDDEVIMVKYLV